MDQKLLSKMRSMISAISDISAKDSYLPLRLKAKEICGLSVIFILNVK